MPEIAPSVQQGSAQGFALPDRPRHNPFPEDDWSSAAGMISQYELRPVPPLFMITRPLGDACTAARPERLYMLTNQPVGPLFNPQDMDLRIKYWFRLI